MLRSFRLISRKNLKRVILLFDKKFFFEIFAGLYGWVVRKLLKKQIRDERYVLEIVYQKNSDSLLASLCDYFGSDKGSLTIGTDSYPWNAHTYTDYYELLFSNQRLKIRNVLECGVGTNNPLIHGNMSDTYIPGASLRVWEKYFPNAEIYGLDIDRSILFQENRIKTFYVDQTNETSIQQFWNQIGKESFDLIIDDGLHTYEGGITFFNNSINYLSPEGHYIIEDVGINLLNEYKKYFDKSKYKIQYLHFHRPNQKLFDNNLIVIKK